MDNKRSRKPLMLARSAIEQLKKCSNKSQAELAKRFFKTGKGEYGYGDKFIGTTVPNIRKIARRFEFLPLTEIEKLTKSKFHEARLCGLIIITFQFKRTKSNLERKKLFNFYLKQLKNNRINNWDLVDVTAPIMGAYLISNPKSMQLLRKLAKSKKLWEKRSAVLFTFAYLRVGKTAPTIAIVKILVKDKHDLIQKAVGWALREVGKKNLPLLRSFLNENSRKMGRTSLRYAIEKLSEAERKKWLNLK